MKYTISERTMTEDLTPLPMFLREHYHADYLEDVPGGRSKIADDVRHWTMVSADAKRFPNADREYIEKFIDAAISYSV